MKNRTYKPMQVVIKVFEEYGQILTPSVISKYYYEILKDIIAPRNANDKLNYTEQEVVYFAKIAILRSLGYGLKEIKDIFMEIMSKGRTTQEVQIYDRIAKSIMGLNKISF